MSLKILDPLQLQDAAGLHFISRLISLHRILICTPSLIRATPILTKLEKICDLTSRSFILFQSVWLQRGLRELQSSHGKNDFCRSTWKNRLIIHPGAHVW